MNIFQGVKFNSMQFIAPLIILTITMFTTTLIFRLLFGWLPKKLFNFLLGPVARKQHQKNDPRHITLR